MGGDEGAERVCERAFLLRFTFSWLFLFTPDFAPYADSLSVFNRNSVLTFNNRKYTLILTKTKTHRRKKYCMLIIIT